MERLSSVAVVCIAVMAGTASGLADTREERLGRFLAGCKVLKAEVTVPAHRKAAALRWLVEDTGLTPGKAAAMVESYRSHPKRWARVLEVMKEMLSPNKGEQPKRKDEQDGT